MALNKEWIKLRNRSCRDYIDGVDGFLDFSLCNIREEEKNIVTIRCPCNRCRNLVFKRRCDVRFDLLKWGIYENYITWEFHGERRDYSHLDNISDGGYGEEDDRDDNVVHMLKDAFGVEDMNVGIGDDIPNDQEEPKGDAVKFYCLLEQHREPLTTNDTTMSKLSYIVKLLHLKVLNNWSDSSFDCLLKLHTQAWGTKLPDSYYEVKPLITDLGLECIKIDACENDCILYWQENEHLNECSTCHTPRRKKLEKGPCNGAEVPRKVLRYFPLKSRLQRLYMCRKTAKEMRWHKEERVDDEVMRHPADLLEWKSFDEEYSSFVADAHNVRLGLAYDGFQPFDNSQHSIWPVIIIPYNLPPWMCMKAESFMLSLIIPGPTCPGRDIDVYLRPLVEELKKLWDIGVETYDAYSKQNFVLHAALLWTISDFPAYADLSGWSTKGNFACPPCHKETRRTSLLNKGGYLGHRRWLEINHRWRKDVDSFNKTKEKATTPKPLTRDEISAQFQRFEQGKFGKVAGKKRKLDDREKLYGWQKKSIFFWELP